MNFPRFHIQKENPEKFTFHSFRRSSATLAAGSGASAQQMQDFFGWKSPSITMEYISTSKYAVIVMANKLNPMKQETEDPVRKGEALKNNVDPVMDQQEDDELDNVETNNG